MKKDYKQLYLNLKKWLDSQGIEIPIDVEPYTEEERAARALWPQPACDPHLYWNLRDKQDYYRERGCEYCE